MSARNFLRCAFLIGFLNASLSSQESVPLELIQQEEIPAQTTEKQQTHADSSNEVSSAADSNKAAAVEVVDTLKAEVEPAVEAQPKVIPKVVPKVVSKAKPTVKEQPRVTSKPQVPKPELKKNLLVLSGDNGYNALQHIGVLKAIERFKIRVDSIHANGIGALIARMWVNGYTPDEIQSFFENNESAPSLLATPANYNSKIVSKNLLSFKTNQSFLALQVGGRIDLSGELPEITDIPEALTACSRFAILQDSVLHVPGKNQKILSGVSSSSGIHCESPYSAQTMYQKSELRNPLLSLKRLPENTLILYSEASPRKQLEVKGESVKLTQFLDSKNNVLAAARVESWLAERKGEFIQVQAYSFTPEYKLLKTHKQKVRYHVEAGFNSLRKSATAISKFSPAAVDYQSLRQKAVLFGGDIQMEPSHRDFLLDNVSGPSQNYLRSFLQEENPRFQVLKEIQNDPFFYDVEISSIKDSTQLLLQAKDQAMLHGYAGVIADEYRGPSIAGGISYSFLQQLAISLQANGVWSVGDKAPIRGGWLSMKAKSGKKKGFFLNVTPVFMNMNFGELGEFPTNNNIQYGDDFNTGDGRPYASQMIRQNLREFNGNLGMHLGKERDAYSSIEITNSEYFTSYMSYVNEEHLTILSQPFENTEVRTIHLGLNYSKKKEELDDLFSLSEGLSGLVGVGTEAHSMMIPGQRAQTGIYYSSILKAKYRKPLPFGLLGVNVENGFNFKTFSTAESSNGLFVPPDSLEVVDSLETAPLLDRFLQPHVNPTIYSNRFPHIEYHSHSYLFSSVTVHLGKNGNGLWIFPGVIHRRDGADQIWGTPNLIYTLEAMLRFKVGKVNFMAGAEQNSANAEWHRDEGEWLGSTRYFVQIGTLGI